MDLGVYVLIVNVTINFKIAKLHPKSVIMSDKLTDIFKYSHSSSETNFQIRYWVHTGYGHQTTVMYSSIE